MASKTTLNAKNLETLGAERLAALLIEISTGSAAAKRRLRLELAGSESSAEVARAVRKRLSSIDRARTIVNWRRIKALKSDLETQRAAISDTIAPGDPQEALELLWQFMAVADSVFQRCDDSNGTIIEVFHAACADLGRVAGLARPAGALLADRTFRALQDNDYGQYDDLIEALAPALGEQGLEQLKAHCVEWSNAPAEAPPESERVVLGWGMNGPVYRDEIDGSHRTHTIQAALERIADLQGDVDAFIAQKSETAQKAPMIAAEIAGRLLAAGRAEDAWIAIEKIDRRSRAELPFEWEQTRIEVMEALGRKAEAERFRLQCFERSLSVEHLRAYVKTLPDFDDMEAEERAFAYAQAFPDANRALHFFLAWPAIAEAAKLVLARPTEFDGNLYELLTQAAEMLQERHPLAAVILLRTMIDFTLEHARSTRYRHAARHLVEASALSRRFDDTGDMHSQQSYLQTLRKKHGKKHGFWSMLPQELTGL